MSIEHISTLHDFWLKYLLPPPSKYYKHIYGTAIGYPICPCVVNLFMEEFESKAISTTPTPPRLEIRYVDDTFVIHQAEHGQQFLQNINSINPCIQFTTQVPSIDGFIPFLDTLVSLGPDNMLLTSMYRKTIHTDQFLYRDSHHNLCAEYNVFNTLTLRARTVCTKTNLLKKRKNTSEVLYTGACAPLGNQQTPNQQQL